MKTWRTLSRITTFERPPRVWVESHRVELTDGSIIEDWPWVVIPDYVTIVAVTKAGLFLVFRQTKYAVSGTTLAPAGGYLEPGDSPLSAARRELLEETGHESDHWTPLGSYAGDANRGCGTGHFFLALGAHAVADPVADDLEEQHLLALDRREIETALRTGEFKVMSWAAAVALALLALDDARAVVA